MKNNKKGIFDFTIALTIVFFVIGAVLFGFLFLTFGSEIKETIDNLRENFIIFVPTELRFGFYGILVAILIAIVLKFKP